MVIGFAARQFIRRAGNDFCKELGKWTPANGEADYDQNLENCSDMAHYLGLDMFPAKNKKIFEAALKNIIRDRIVSAEFALY